MIKAILSVFRVFRPQPVRGFVYAPRDDGGPMATAAAGRRVQIAGPPWIVVDRGLPSIIVASWPGRLWEVEIVDPISSRDLLDDAGYTRAAGVRVLHEVPVAVLFGSHGAEVCAVIDAAAGLTLERTARLAAARRRDAGRAQTRAWQQWLSRQNIPPDRYGDALDGTLAVSGVQSGSPIGEALSVISGEVGRRAKAIGGPSVWITRDGDPEEVLLSEPWSTASMTLLDAALAFGAPDLMHDDDRSLLAAAWREVVVPDPA
jgi:hypothetical protein